MVDGTNHGAVQPGGKVYADTFVRPYANLPQRRERIGYAIKLWVVAWGADTTLAYRASNSAELYARCWRFTVLGTVASHGIPMSTAPLVHRAKARFEYRDVDYGEAWWLVPHSAISRDDFERARTAVHARWIADAAERGEMRAPALGAL